MNDPKGPIMLLSNGMRSELLDEKILKRIEFWQTILDSYSVEVDPAPVIQTNIPNPK